MNYVTSDGDFSFAHIITGGHNDGRASLWFPNVFGNNTLENITAIKGYFEVCPMDKLTISGAVVWAMWTEDIGWNAGTRAALFAPDQPAYEFPTGYADTRVLARRLRGQDEWLVTAWAADGTNRTVSVSIPDLGTVDLLARDCGSVYRATTDALTLLDPDGVFPTEFHTGLMAPPSNLRRGLAPGP